MTKFKCEGKRINYTPVSAVAAGDVIVLGGVVCVATDAIPAGTLGSLAIEGVFEFPKTGGSGGSAMAVGEFVDWDGSVICAADVTTTTRQAGFVFKAAGATDTTVDVKLMPGRSNLGSGS